VPSRARDGFRHRWAARQQQAKSWACSDEHGQRQQALDLLVQVYGWFTEGLDALDLKEAKALRTSGPRELIGSSRDF
jgi:hypothetical protein